MFIPKRLRALATALVATALVSPLASAAGSDHGLLITQVTGSKWQVRLIAGTASAQRFSGTFSAVGEESTGAV